MRYIFDDAPSTEAIRTVEAGLLEFSDAFTGPRRTREFALVARNEDGEVVGGVTGDMVWEWLQIGTLWVREIDRGLGLGRRLVEQAETLARRQGCDSARLSTFEFEARGFYEHLGYRVYGECEGFPAGRTQYHLAKRLAAD